MQSLESYDGAHLSENKHKGCSFMFECHLLFNRPFYCFSFFTPECQSYSTIRSHGVERFGRYQRTLEPGLHFVIP